jgi:hypothetical protein
MNNQFSPDPQSGESAGAFSSSSSSTVKQSVRETGEKIMTKAKEVASEAKQQSGQYVAQNRNRAADRIGRIGESLRHTADEFEQDEDPNIAHYVRVMADKIENVATYVRDQDLPDLRRDAESFARQHPVLFYGGLCTLGFAAGRFVKASGRQEGPLGTGTMEEEQLTARTPVAEGI